MLLRRLGLSEAAARAISGIMRREWKSVLGSISMAVIVPMFELAMVTMLFAVVSPAEQGAFTRTVRQWLALFSLSSTDRAVSLVLLGCSLVALVLVIVGRFLQKSLSLGVNMRTYVRFATALVGGFLDAPPQVNRRLSREEFINALHAEIGAVGAFVYDLVGVASSGISAFVLIAGAFVISPAMTTGALVVPIVYAAIARSRYRRHRAIIEEKIQVQAELLGRVVDVFSGYRPIRLAGAEKTFTDRLNQIFVRTTGWRIKQINNQTVLTTLSQAFIYMIMLTVVLVVVFLSTDLSGRALVILVLIQRIFSSLSQFQQDWLKVQAAVVGTEKIVDLLQQCNPEWGGAGEETRPHAPIRRVALENVGFSYEDGQELYHGLNLELQAGDRVLIQGVSGIGKSTLALIACGMLEPTSGSVLIDGKELDQTRFRQLRSQISYVCPDLHVFNMPICDNVFLSGSADVRVLNRIVEFTRMEAVVERLGGTQIPVGADGENLSLGERQRLLLMQAFLKQPSFLILDEATSNLDIELEDAVLKSLLDTLSPEAILLVIAHKRPEKMDFTHHYILKPGQIVLLDRSSPILARKQAGANLTGL